MALNLKKVNRNAGLASPGIMNDADISAHITKIMTTANLIVKKRLSSWPMPLRGKGCWITLLW